MRIYIQITIFGLILINQVSIYAQVWPLSPMNRLGNTIYYTMDSLSSANLTGTNIIFDKDITNRYFDVILIKDSIELVINDSLSIFSQKFRTEPKCYKNFVFYKRRYLENSNKKIRYLKLIEINDTMLIAKATIKNLTEKCHSKSQEKISIGRKDIRGIFLGTGKNHRVFMTVVELCAGIVFII